LAGGLGSILIDFIRKYWTHHPTVKNTVRLFSNNLVEWMPSAHFRVGSAVNVSVDTPEEADRIFAALAKDGVIRIAIAETFWAQRFGMCTDRFGTPFMVNCEKPM
jgi:uncharacterized glyoxalase superfamily protein PhnB